MQHNIVQHALKILLIIFMGLLLISCASKTGASTVHVSDTAENRAEMGYPASTPDGDENVVLEAYPPPHISSDESRVPTTQQPGQETLPWPTFTPIPTPSRQPGPTPTALLLLEPSQSTTESLVYLEKQEGNSLLPFHFLVEESGEVSTLPILVSEPNIGINLGEPVSLYPSPNGKYAIFTDGWGRRYVLNSDTGEQRPLFQKMLDPKGQSFNWHPDNKHFLMEAEDGSPDVGLWLVDVETEEYSVLLHQFPSPYIVAGAISSDGQHVVYGLDANKSHELTSDFEKTYEVWLSDINGDNAQLIWESNTHVGLFSWSPDGRYLAMNGGRIMDMENFVVSTVTDNMADGYGYAFHPVWSPDSRHIAFVAFDEPNPLTDGFLPLEGYSTDIFRGTNIHVLDIETSEENILVQNKGTGHIYPTWSPDGLQIAFVSNMSGKSDIWVIDVDGGNLRQLTNSQNPATFPYWIIFSNVTE